ncbi:MAG: hypothetical protein BGO59_31970 [Spirosoma sp. 48-14]|nr:MAG: hypothetical protein BGO59_31970 [Spirosoma sp. 48-14]
MPIGCNRLKSADFKLQNMLKRSVQRKIHYSLFKNSEELSGICAIIRKKTEETILLILFMQPIAFSEN